MLKHLIWLVLLTSCVSKPVSELDGLTRDVLQSKSGQGIDIEVKPIPKDK